MKYMKGSSGHFHEGCQMQQSAKESQKIEYTVIKIKKKKTV